MATIAFHTNQLGLRGTEIASYDYAKYNEELFLNRSVIVTPERSPMHHPAGIERFKRRFPVLAYENIGQLEKLLEDNGCQALYCIKSGERDSVISQRVPTLVHCVFKTTEPHGSVYAAVSDYVAGTGGGAAPVVPHVVDLPLVKGDLRAQLGIPKGARVFGRHGGPDTFDLAYVKQVITEIAAQNRSTFFVFLNVPPFCRLDNVLFLNGTADPAAKAKFINTCDAMIHGQSLGESFGLACAEFSFLNKPIITNLGGVADQHIRNLGRRGIYYKDAAELRDILLTFSADGSKNWDCFSERFNPLVVMQRFREVFLDPFGLVEQVNREATAVAEASEGNFEVLVNDSLGCAVAKEKAWEPHLVQLFERLVGPDDFTADVGANFGYHTIAMARRCPRGRVLAFEPQPCIFDLLRVNCIRNRAYNVRLYPFAVLAEQGEGTVQHNPLNSGDVWVGAGSGGGQKVACVKLDQMEIEGPLRIVKLDIQGAEPLAIKGSIETIKRHRPFLAVEVEDSCLQRYGFKTKDLFDLLSKIGYLAFLVEYPYPSDVLAVPIEKLEELRALFEGKFAPLTSGNSINKCYEAGVREKLCLL